MRKLLIAFALLALAHPLAAQRVDLSTAGNEPFGDIAREFSQEGSFWKFELRKSGSVRTIYPLPEPMLPIAAVISMLFAAVASATAFHAGASPATRWSHSSVVVRYESPVDITVGEPVIVTLTVDNQREDAIRVDLGFDRTEKFVVTVMGPAGRPHTAALLQPPLPDSAGRGGRVLVSPSQTFSHQLVLNQWFRFDQAGIHVVEIRLKTGIATAAGTPIDVPTAGHFTIVVRPRSESAVKVTCERLAQTVIETADVAQRLDAARALSYIVDPVAVSYMASVLASTDAADSLLIPALARIGGAEAWETLKRLQNSPDRDRASLASRFLRMDRSTRFDLRRSASSAVNSWPAASFAIPPAAATSRGAA